MSHIETVKVVAADPEAGGFYIINKDDFDPAIHKLYKEPKAGKPKAAASADPAPGGDAAADATSPDASDAAAPGADAATGGDQSPQSQE